MAKTWIPTITGNVMVRRSHITDLYIHAGKTEEDKYSDHFSYFVNATARGEGYAIAGPFKTREEAKKWMKDNFK